MNERTLIYIPIIHTPQDMGGLSNAVHQAAAKLIGTHALKQKNQRVNQLWTTIEKLIDHLDLPFAKVRLYQDGLPECGREMDIVTDLADGGSRNHRLLMRLIRKGAVLMGTESAELLLEEYRLISQTVSGRTGTVISADQHQKADNLLKKRDQFIAQRINSTLEPSETGIIFLGMLHDLHGLIDKEIQIIYPLKDYF